MGYTENTCAYEVGCWEDSEYGGCLCVSCFDAGNGVQRVEYTALPKKVPGGVYRVGAGPVEIETHCEYCGQEVKGYVS